MNAAESAKALLAPWTGPYGGVPAFEQYSVAGLAPAMEAAMAQQLDEVEAIAKQKETPTFENTIAQLERAGRAYERVETVYGVYSSTLSNPEFQEVERALEPKMAAFFDKITQNAPLFARIEAVYESRQSSGLTPEQERLVWLTYTNFVRAGAKLDAANKARMSEINQRLASLFTDFGQHVLNDEGGQMTIIENASELAGLPESFVQGAAAAATEAGKSGKWAILNTRSSMEPFLVYSDNRALREKVWKTYYSRGDNGDANDNNAIISEILKLRAERAQLLGYATHAHWRVESQMAETPEKAMQLLEAVWKPAVGRVHEEVAEMQALADRLKHGITIAPWDYRYYMEKVRKEKYDLDETEITPYMQLEKLREGMFWVAGQLFGLQFQPAKNVPIYHPDVRVWEVLREGKSVGLWYFDPYARKGKRSGAWMNAYRRQSRMDGEITTIVSNNSNFVKSTDGPVLISWEDAETLFHEFGHALHGLSSNVTYPSVSGTAVARDFVEFPSQLLEHWLATPEVLNQFALHHKTGVAIPKELVTKIARAKTFNQGFATVEYLASALIDMRLHLAGSTPIDADAFERDTLTSMGMPTEIVMRHRTPQFNHVFSSDGYSAGYYSYLWADTLTADAFEAFTEAGGPYDKAVAARLHQHIFSTGNTQKPADAYRAFRGRDAGISALMRKRGFPQ
jgi:peptidyl-dipeptidase Dcp